MAKPSKIEVSKTINMYKQLNKSEKYYIIGAMQAILIMKGLQPNKSA